MQNQKVYLAGKEATQFKTILRFYEHKQYKKGLKTTESILKKYPDHGETTAMKGLFLSHLDRSVEAHAFIKMGLRLDLTSHICWHVYGLLHRGEKNYEEAIKCYHHALKYDKDNINIIRDYSLLLVHMRNFEQYVTIRHQLLTIKPNNKMYWLGLVVAHHLNKQYAMAIKILDAFQDTQDKIDDVYEYSELMLYRNMILEENGEFKEALDHLRSIEFNIVDRVTFQEAKGTQNIFIPARILMALDKKSAALGVYHSLLDHNNDSEHYLHQLEVCMDHSNPAEFYLDMRERFPRSKIIHKNYLMHSSEENWFNLINEFMKPEFLKGVPSLFGILKDIYKDAWRVQAIEQVVSGYYKCLQESNKFSIDDDELAPPSSTLWVAYFLAQHYDKLNQIEKALEWIQIAQAHTPTLPEVHMIKAKIYKHGGALKLAMNAMNDARELDLQDRFINTKCTKYMLRNDEQQRARNTIALFTKVDVDPLEDLKEMQCMWFALEFGESFARQKKYGLALKRFAQIEKHFVEIYDDQFDFHNYCLRKATLRNYIQLLRNEDCIRAHKYWRRASIGAIKTYIAILDKDSGPLQLAGLFDHCLHIGELSVSDRKKAARKAKKVEQAQMAAQQVSNKNAPAKKVEDEDPDGLKLVDLSAAELLIEAVKYVVPLQDLSPQNLEAWIYGVDLYTRQSRFLLAWRSLKRAHLLAGEHPLLYEQMIKFHLKLNCEFSGLSKPVQDVLKQQFQKFPMHPQNCPESKVASSLLQSLIQKHSDSSAHILSIVAMQVGYFDANIEAQSMISKLVDRKLDMTLETAIALWTYGQFFGGHVMHTFASYCREKFALSTMFSEN